MNQQIRLTWRDGSDNVIVEECQLVSEEDAIFTFNGELTEGVMEEMVAMNFVVFEDEEGIFGLIPEQVINIERL